MPYMDFGIADFNQASYFKGHIGRAATDGTAGLYNPVRKYAGKGRYHQRYPRRRDLSPRTTSILTLTQDCMAARIRLRAARPLIPPTYHFTGNPARRFVPVLSQPNNWHPISRQNRLVPTHGHLCTGDLHGPSVPAARPESDLSLFTTSSTRAIPHGLHLPATVYRHASALLWRTVSP